MIVEVHRIQIIWGHADNGTIDPDPGTCFFEIEGYEPDDGPHSCRFFAHTAALEHKFFVEQPWVFDAYMSLGENEFTPVSDDLADAIRAYVALADSHIIPDDFRFEGAL
jgi:hypothetical protein